MQGWDGRAGLTHSLAALFTLSLTCFQEGFEELIIKAPGASACRDGRDRVSAGAWLGRGWHGLAGPGPAHPEGWRRADFRGVKGGGFWGGERQREEGQMVQGDRNWRQGVRF